MRRDDENPYGDEEPRRRQAILDEMPDNGPGEATYEPSPEPSPEPSGGGDSGGLPPSAVPPSAPPPTYTNPGMRGDMEAPMPGASDYASDHYDRAPGPESQIPEIGGIPNYQPYPDYFPPGTQFPTPGAPTPPPGPDRATATPPGGPAGGADAQRDPIRKFVTDVLARFGKQPTGRNSGPTDLEYYVDKIIEGGGLGTGYDWAGRIERGIKGTQPPLPGQGGAQGGGQQRGNLGGYSYNPQSGYQFGYSGGQGGLPPEIANFYRAQTEAMQRQQAERQQVEATMRDALLKLMAQGQEPVDVANDKTLGPAAAAYRNAQRREQGQGRQALAERLAAMGLNQGGQGGGAFDQALQSNEQDVRNDISGYEAKLAMTELGNRRNMLVQALQIAQAFGARTEANDLQRELAGIDAQLRQQGLTFNYAQLGQNQSQFEDDLGYRYANLQNQMNRDAFLGGMGD